MATVADSRATRSIDETRSSQVGATVRWPSILGILEKLCNGEELLDGVLSLVNTTTCKTQFEISQYPEPTSDPKEVGSELHIDQWISRTEHVPLDHPLRHHLDFALAIAFLRESGRQGAELSPTELESVWGLVRKTLAETSIVKTTYRSNQGCLIVPLWRVVRDNKIQELIQLRVWLPDGKRGVNEVVIRSHRSPIQKWILFGQVQESKYEVRQADQNDATHTKYAGKCGAGRDDGIDTVEPEDLRAAEIIKTEDFVQERKMRSETHSTYATYTIEPGTFCESRVKPDDMHAALVFLDVDRGSQPDAFVLSPTTGLEHYQDCDPGEATPAALAATIEAFRGWERFHQKGLAHTRDGEPEEALLAHRNSLEICDGNVHFPRDSHYRYTVLAELGYVYRILGRYLQARDYLEETIRNMPHNDVRIRACGELAVVYRQLGRLEDSKRVCEEQYETAKKMGFDREIGRAIGNLGMVNYQLFLLNDEQEYLSLAIAQLEERIELCHRQKSANTSALSAQDRYAAVQTSIGHEAIAFARLSLCYTSQGNIKKAIDAAVECQKLSIESHDPNKIAFSRLFLGRALLLNGQKEDARAEINPSDGNTPVMVLSREPSEEHRGYIRELIDAGADLTIRDINGYSALDYAVYSGDETAQEMISEGLRRVLRPDEVEAHHLESVLRKGYRELFQDKLRPVLSRPDRKSGIKQLRQVYASTLTIDKEKARQFDSFKYIRYADFVQFGRLPKSTDGLARRLQDDSNEGKFVIFTSYTWTKKAPGEELSPDDSKNTRFHQMNRAVKSLLEGQSDIDPATVCLWIDWACIDQVDRDVQARGIAALPMCITQCDAMISIVDPSYYSRAWCCVEVVTIQVLQRSYNVHHWFEYTEDPTTEKGVLRNGSLSEMPSVASAHLTLASDRPKVSFLERQARLLDNASYA